MSLTKTLVGVGILGGLGAFVYAFYAYANKQTKLLEDFTWKLMGVKFDSYDLQAVKGKVEILFTSQSDVEVKEFLKSSGRHISMDAPLSSEDDGDMYDVLSSNDEELPDSDLISHSLRMEIERILTTLSPRESDIVRLYFGLSGKHAYSLEEIGEEFGLTRERVRQIKEKAIRRLIHTSKSKLLKSYFGN